MLSVDAVKNFFKFAVIAGMLLGTPVVLAQTTVGIECTCEAPQSGTPCTGNSGSVADTDACIDLCGGDASCVAGATPVETTEAGPASSGPIVGFGNPICPDPSQPCEIPDIIAGVIRAVLGIVGSIALVIFVYGGLLWMTASGDTEKIKKAKGALTWAVLGMLVIFLSYIIVNFIITQLVE